MNVTLHQHPLFFARRGQFVLQLDYISLVLGHQRFALRQLLFERLHPIRKPALFQQRVPGEIVAALVDGQLGPLRPPRFARMHVLDLAADLLPLGHRARARGLDLDERVLHLPDHQPHQLLRVLGFVEHRIDVRTDDVGNA